jgi:hypothetical protein
MLVFVFSSFLWLFQQSFSTNVIIHQIPSLRAMWSHVEPVPCPVSRLLHSRSPQKPPLSVHRARCAAQSQGQAQAPPGDVDRELQMSICVLLL